jgi:hypothetical protein
LESALKPYLKHISVCHDDGEGLGIDKKMSKEELIEFEGLVIEILPGARYRVQLDAGYESWPTRWAR